MPFVAKLLVFLAFAYVVFSWIEYSGHRWLLHKIRLANRLCSDYLRRMCINHMKLHHGSDYEHEHDQKDDDPVQLTVAGVVVGFVITLPIYLVSALCAKVFIAAGVLYAVVMYLVHLEMHRRRGWFYSRTRLFRHLERRHRLHHLHPDTNFNVLLPLFDWLLGTSAVIPSEEMELTVAAAHR